MKIKLLTLISIFNLAQAQNIDTKILDNPKSETKINDAITNLVKKNAMHWVDFAERMSQANFTQKEKTERLNNLLKEYKNSFNPYQSYKAFKKSNLILAKFTEQERLSLLEEEALELTIELIEKCEVNHGFDNLKLEKILK